jgi:hypothetical protein
MPDVNSRQNIKVKIFRSFDEEAKAEREYWRSLTPAERVDMMWQLTLDAWSFTGAPIAESRLPRHIVSIHRGKS